MHPLCVAQLPLPLSARPLRPLRLVMATPTEFVSSPHVDLLAHYQRVHSGSPTETEHALRFDEAEARTLLVSTSPAIEPQAGESDDPAVLLPLPREWSRVRREQLKLPSEQRTLPALRVDTSDPRLLRRGLWLACATMYFPSVLKAEDALIRSSGEQLPEVSFSSLADLATQSAAAVVAAPSVLERISELRVPKSFEVSVVSGGITNQLYRCSLSSHSHAPVLVRIYGPRTELVIDRSKENEVVDVLSVRQQGPRIFGRFENGRLESWLSGHSLTPAEMREPGMARMIAATLAKLHCQSMPFPRSPVIASVLRKWSQIASEVRFPDNAAKQAILDRLNLPEVVRAVDEFLARVESSYYGSRSALVFAHNDLLSGNIMFDAGSASPAATAAAVSSSATSSSPSSSAASPSSAASASAATVSSSPPRVFLVDFEYANFNPRAFDLANHFAECCGFECEWEHFPKRTQMCNFMESYLHAVQRVQAEQAEQQAVVANSELGATVAASAAAALASSSSSSLPMSRACMELYAEVQCWLLAPHLFWTLWAVVQGRHSPIDFEYLPYSLLRFQAFKDMKPRWEQWVEATPDTIEKIMENEP